MKAEKIFVVSGEGGDITLAKREGKYFQTSQETLLIDEKMDVGDMHVIRPEYFDTFHDCMMRLLERYPIFWLYPDYIHPDYIERLKVYVDVYFYKREDEALTRNSWIRFIKDEKEKLIKS